MTVSVDRRQKKSSPKGLLSNRVAVHRMCLSKDWQAGRLASLFTNCFAEDVFFFLLRQHVLHYDYCLPVTKSKALNDCSVFVIQKQTYVDVEEVIENITCNTY